MLFTMSGIKHGTIHIGVHCAVMIVEQIMKHTETLQKHKILKYTQN